MKKAMVVVFGVLFFCGLITGCGQSKEEAILGKWIEIDGTETLEFLKDRTVICQEKDEQMVGKYGFINENRMKIEFKGLGELIGPVIAEFPSSRDELILNVPPFFGSEAKVVKYRRWTKEDEAKRKQRKVSQRQKELEEVGKQLRREGELEKVGKEIREKRGKELEERGKRLRQDKELEETGRMVRQNIEELEKIEKTRKRARESKPVIPTTAVLATKVAPVAKKPMTKTTALPKLTAEPLPGGVVFDRNLSISIAVIERQPQVARIWLAFRRVSEKWPRSTRSFNLRIFDDRENRYGTSFHLGPAAGVFALKYTPSFVGNLPSGFTWVDLIQVRMPQIAPIARVEIERKFWNWLDYGERPSRVSLQLASAKPSFPNFGFQIKPEHLFSPGKEITIDNNLSIQFGELKVNERKTGFVVLLPMRVKNVDYNPHSIDSFSFYVQFRNGIIYGSGGGGGTRIPAQSIRELNLTIGTLRERPRLVILLRGRNFLGFVPIPKQAEKKISEIERKQILLNAAKAKLKKWAKDNLVIVIDHGAFGGKQKIGIDFYEYFVMGNHIWAAGGLSGYGGHGHLVHSPDGGNSWEVQWKDRYRVPQKVKFFGEDKGVLVTDKSVLRTSDGGKTWNGILRIENLKIPKRRWIRLQIEDPLISYFHRILFRIGKEVSVCTNNGGKTWELYDRKTKIKMQTRDGGETWQKDGQIPSVKTQSREAEKPATKATITGQQLPKQVLPRYIVVPNFAKGIIQYRQGIKWADTTAYITHRFRESIPESAKGFTVELKDANSGTITVYALQHLDKRKIIKFSNIPVTKVNDTWKITEVGEKQIRFILQSWIGGELIGPQK